MVDYLEEQNAEKIAFIVEANDYSVWYAQVVKDSFQGEIVFDEKVNTEEKDLSIVAKKVADNIDNLDMLVFIPVNESFTNNMFTALDNEGVLEQLQDRIIWAEAMLNEVTRDAFWAKLNGTKTVILSSINDLWDNALSLADKMLAWYEVNSNESFMVLLADSADLVLDAIKEVWYESDAIQQYLANIDQTNPRESFFLRVLFWW